MTDLEHQRCPFEGAYTIEATSESDLTYNPSNIFICPRQSYLMAQCDHPSRLRIHSRCSQSKTFVKSEYFWYHWRLPVVDKDGLFVTLTFLDGCRRKKEKQKTNPQI